MTSYGLSRALFALLLLVMFPSMGSATSIRSFTMTEMVHESAVVLRGKVTSQKAQWKQDKSAIYTDSTVHISAIYRGRVTQKTVTIRQLGGTLDGLEMSVVGTAKLSVGEDVFLFLRTNGTHHFLVGMAQGKYRVQKTADKTTVTRNLSGIHRMHNMQRVGTQHIRNSEREIRTLSQLIATVQAVTKAKKVTP